MEFKNILFILILLVTIPLVYSENTRIVGNSLIDNRDTNFEQNFTNMMVDVPVGNCVYGLLGNGTWKWRTCSGGAGGGDFSFTDFYDSFQLNISNWKTTTGDTTYLNLSGTNANQDINISPYNFTANYGFFDGVGIGTSSLDTLLDLEDNAVTLATIQTTATNAEYAGLNVKSPVGTWGLYTGTTSHSLIAGDFGIFDVDAGVYRFVIKDDGRVGIGTSNPNRKLDIEGTASVYMEFDATDYSQFVIGSESRGFIIYDDTTNDYRMVIQNESGNVGIGTTTPTHTLDIIGDFLLTHTAIGTDEHGLELKIDAAGFGDVKGIDLIYTTGAIVTGDDEGAILISIDEFEATGGDVFGVEVLSTEGGANVWGYKVGAVVGAVHQDSGIFEDMDSVDNNGVDNLAEFISTVDDVAIFVNDNDYVTIGDANKFEEIEFILDTSASKNVKPIFYYSTGETTWGEFSPVDGTNGFENTGIIAWEDADIPTWATSGGEYLIRVNRTKNNIQTNPIENLVQIAAIIEYYWDKNGYLNVHNISAVNISVEQEVTINGKNVSVWLYNETLPLYDLFKDLWYNYSLTDLYNYNESLEMAQQPTIIDGLWDFLAFGENFIDFVNLKSIGLVELNDTTIMGGGGFKIDSNVLTSIASVLIPVGSGAVDIGRADNLFGIVYTDSFNSTGGGYADFFNTLIRGNLDVLGDTEMKDINANNITYNTGSTALIESNQPAFCALVNPNACNWFRTLNPRYAWTDASGMEKTNISIPSGNFATYGNMRIGGDYFSSDGSRGLTGALPATFTGNFEGGILTSASPPDLDTGDNTGTPICYDKDYNFCICGSCA